MMNGMKGILLALLLITVSAAQVTATQDFNGKLYTVRTDPSLDFLNIEPRLHFENTITASTTARVIYGGPASNLQDNAIICEGDVSLAADADGVWAHNGLYEYVDYWLECDPPSYTSVSNNRPIFWDTGSYDNLFGVGDICSSEDGCWAIDDGFVTQRVDTYQVYLDDPSSRTFNREGRTSVFCKGRKTLRADGTLVASGVMESDRGVLLGAVPLLRGTHSITDDMEVTGCLGAVRFPQCRDLPNFEKIFSRTRAERGYSAPAYTTALQARMNIRAVTNADLRCSAEFVSVTPDPLVVAPGNSTSATVTIRNNCPASDPLCQPITVTGVTVSDGFRFMYFLRPGMSLTAAPGRSVSIGGSLTAPNEEGICTELTRGITFNVTYTCPGCGPAGDTLSRTATYTVRFECPPSERTNLIPRFEPDLSRYDVVTGEDPNITIITRNNGPGPSNAGETCIQVGHYQTITIGPFGPPTTIFIPDFPEYRYSYPAMDASEQYGEALDFMCSEDMENNTYVVLVNVDCPGFGTTNETDETDNDDSRFISCVPPNIPPPGEGEQYRCDINPEGPISGVPGEEYDFDLLCTMLGSPVDCPGDTEWHFSSEGNATLTGDEGGNSAGGWLTLGTDSRGEGNVHVVAEIRFPDGNASCSSDINIPLVPCEEFV